MKVCNRCSVELTSENWTESAKKKYDYICKPCHNVRHKTRPLYKQQRVTKTTKKIFESTLSRKISNFIQDAKKRQIGLFLDYEQIGKLMQSACNYCGDSSTYNGLDRVNSSMEYTKENVVPCCKFCNWGKNTMTSEQFINHCKKIVVFQGVA